MVPFLKVREAWRSGAAGAGHTLTLTPSSHAYLEHGLWEVPVEEPHHVLYVLAAFGPDSDHVAVPKPGRTQVSLGVLPVWSDSSPAFCTPFNSPVLEVLDAAQAA